MKGAWLVLATVAALALQTALTRFVARGLTLDLVLVVVVWAALTSGPVSGLLTGTFAGLLQDAMSTGVIGIGGLAKTLVGFGVGLLSTQFIVSQAPARFVVFFVATVVHAAFSIGVYELLGLREFGTPYASVLEQALGNAVVGVVVYELSEFLPGAARRRQLARSGSRR